MKSTELKSAVQSGVEPIFTNTTERCLWLAGIGEWERAHDIVESLPEPAASWIHAMLHRDEGDLGNADYWYRRAERPMPSNSVSIAAELEQITIALLGE